MNVRNTRFSFAAALLATGFIAAPSIAAAGEGSHGHHGSARGQERSSGSRRDGSTGPSGATGKHGSAGQSHKCLAHSVAYVASGALVSQSATRNSDGTYSGTLTVEVKRTNHHGAADRGSTQTYTLDHARVHLTGSAGLEGVKAGDRVKLIGRITTLPRKCSTEGFSPAVTIRMVVIHS